MDDDQPLSLVTENTKNLETKSEQVQMSPVAPTKYSHPTEITEHVYDASDTHLGIVPHSLEYRIKNCGDKSVFVCAESSNRGDFDPYDVQPVLYQQELAGQDQCCSRQSGESIPYMNRSRHQYYNRNVNEVTSSEQLVTSPYLLSTSHTRTNNRMPEYEASSPFYDGQSHLQQNRQNFMQEQITKNGKKVTMDSTDHMNVLNANDIHTSPIETSPVNYDLGQHVDGPSQVRSMDLSLVASQISGNCVNQNVGRRDSMTNVMSSSLNRQCSANLSRSHSYGKPAQAVHYLSRQFDNISPAQSQTRQTHDIADGEVPLISYSSVRENVHSNLPSHMEQLSPSTGRPMEEEFQKVQNMSAYQEVDSGKIPNIFQSEAKTVDPSLDNYLVVSSPNTQRNSTSITNKTFEHGELDYDTKASVVKHVNNFEEDENTTGSLISGNRNIPKKRSHMNTSAFTGQKQFQSSANMMTFKQQSHGSLEQTVSKNELPPLGTKTNNSLTMSDTMEKGDQIEINFGDKSVEKDTKAEDERKLRSTSGNVDANVANVSQLRSADKEFQDKALKIGQDSSQLSSLQIGPITMSGGENLSDVSEEQIKEIQRIAAKILARPVSVTWAAGNEKNCPSGQEVKAETMVIDTPIFPNKACRRKQCRKKPLSQVIDMLNQESEQVGRESEKEITIGTIVVKNENDDWMITEPEPKSSPTRKKPASLVVCLKREKVKSTRKTGKKRADKDHRRTRMTRTVAEDPDYKIETRSFHLRNKKNKIVKSKKRGVKKKEDVTSFVCEVCGKEFAAKGTLRLHRVIHVPSRPYVCPECNKAFRHKGNLVKHRQSHTGVRPHICKYCNKGYSSRYALKIHTRKHTGERPFDCTVCEKKFYTKNCLLAHMNIHSGQKNIVCEICGKLFYNQANLYLHMRTHSGERPFLCTVCEMSFAQKVNLVNHTRTHTGEKPFQCETCGHSYAQLSTLQIHIRTHTGEKPFVCALCGKTYATSGGLRMHKKIHGGIKQFKCTYCEKSFVDKSNLKKHVRIHTGEKPYMCDVCGRYFNQSSALRTHWKTHPEIANDTKKKPFRVMPPDELQSSLAVTGQQLVSKFVLEQEGIPGFNPETNMVFQQEI